MNRSDQANARWAVVLAELQRRRECWCGVQAFHRAWLSCLEDEVRRRWEMV